MSTTTPYGYALRVEGHLDRHWRSRFGDLELTHHDDGTSTLAGPVADQSQLHGLLAGLRDIGATLLSVRPVDQPDPDKRSPPPASHAHGGHAVASPPVVVARRLPTSAGCIETSLRAVLHSE